MADLLKRLLLVGLLIAVLAIAVLVWTPDNSPNSAENLTSTGTPSPTTINTPTPSSTSTPNASPTISPTLAPHVECLHRYGEQSDNGAWGDGLSLEAASAAVGEWADNPVRSLSASNATNPGDYVLASRSPDARIIFPSGIDSSNSATEHFNHDTEFLLSTLFTPEVHGWGSDIFRWSEIFGLDPDLVATVMQIESCGHPTLVSPAGAIGLFQVMPFHFLYGEDPFDPETNARRALSLLRSGLELSRGQVELALAIYNGGTGVILEDPADWPSETRDYVTWGSGILDDIKSGNQMSTSLQIWLEAGGNVLCLRSCLSLIEYPLEGAP